ncbi:unnamed protein product [Prorocentrum cordatum]|uniref:Uncharacterized protein n=1 Tax=Prorocentrum cordatum TaxID=2364126 RepID=A0ABN9W2E7_9DINO|nr:unnamed protein product [Polarella glacialis]
MTLPMNDVHTAGTKPLLDAVRAGRLVQHVAAVQDARDALSTPHLSETEALALCAGTCTEGTEGLNLNPPEDWTETVMTQVSLHVASHVESEAS